LFLDEGVPVAVGKTFIEHGHEVIFLEEAIKRGSPDTLVCAVAEANDAILVAFDNDMKHLAQRHGVAGGRFKRLSLIRFGCPEPMAAQRLGEAMSFIEHEWVVGDKKAARRLFIEIGTHVLRTWR
jgi:hypothetical protein